MAEVVHLTGWMLPVLGIAFFGLALALLTWSLSLVRLPPGMERPPEYHLLHRLLALERGVLAAALLALFAWAGLWLPIGVQATMFALYFASLLWLCITTVLGSAAGTKVKPGYVYELHVQPSLLRTTGLSVAAFYGLLVSLFVVTGLLTAGAMRLRAPGASAFLAGSCIALFCAFLVLNVTLRAYLTYSVQRGRYTLLALDESVSIAPGAERLVPHAGVPRPQIVNLGADTGFDRYLEQACHLPPVRFPHRFDVLWLSIESLRYDALAPDTAPRLWAFKDRFQLRLGERHWSGANATHFSMFSMLSGLSALHYPSFVAAEKPLPLLGLLSNNGYALRYAKEGDLKFRKESVLLPPQVEIFDSGTASPEAADEQMTDWYLETHEKSGGGPRFDFLAFDATHWTYFFPPGHAVFQPADPPDSVAFFLHRSEELQRLHNRYRNAVHFVDAQLGRILEYLERSGRLEQTVIIVAGDHGEEFQERGQIAHSGLLNDQNARTCLWLHLPPEVAPRDLGVSRSTMHLDLVPTVLQALGLESDVLHTQGRSLLEPVPPLPLLVMAEQGLRQPSHLGLVTDEYVSRWIQQDRWLWLSSVERRGGGRVDVEAWLGQIRDWYPAAAQRFQVLPDASQPPRRFVQASCRMS